MSRKTSRRIKPNILSKEIKNPIPINQGHTIIQGTVSQTTMPAQLSPEIIAKFDKENIDAIVTSFTKSVTYQNETERETRKEHYRTINITETKRMIYGFLILGSGLSAGIYKNILDGKYLIGLILGAIIIPFIPNILNSMSNFVSIIFHRKDRNINLNNKPK